MLIKKILLVIFIITYHAPPSMCAELFGVGVHIGAQHDVGNPTSYDPSIQVDPQNSLLMGLSSKLNLSPLFFRFGIDNTILINKGKVLDDNDLEEIEYYKINYTASSLFFGLLFPVRRIGKFYMGGGSTYFIGRGKIKIITDTSSTEKIDTSAIGFGFITGIELNLASSIWFYCEWEYMDGKSKAILNADGTDNWKNFYLDFTGNRILLGIIYYLL